MISAFIHKMLANKKTTFNSYGNVQESYELFSYR